jgi:hypothetical protein
MELKLLIQFCLVTIFFCEGTHRTMVGPLTGKGAHLDSIRDAALFMKNVLTFLFGSLLNKIFSEMSSH